jgi:hypothetical protein
MSALVQERTNCCSAANVRFVPGTDIPGRSLPIEPPSSCPTSASRQSQMDYLRLGGELHNAAADFSYRKYHPDHPEAHFKFARIIIYVFWPASCSTIIVRTSPSVFRTLTEGYREGVAMKIHARPPFPPMPPTAPPIPPPTAFQLKMQVEELTKTAEEQRARLKKLHGPRKNSQDLNGDTDSETYERDHRSNRNLDFLA